MSDPILLEINDGTALITRDDVVRLHDALPTNDE